MPEGEVEALRLKGIGISDLLLPKLIERIKEANLNFNAVSLVFVKESEDGKNKILLPFVLGHQNSQELKDKVLHISGPEEEELKKFVTIIKEVAKENE